MVGKGVKAVIGALAFLLVLTPVVSGYSEDWPVSGGNAQRSGYNGYDASHNFGDIKWKFVATDNGIERMISQSLGQPSFAVGPNGTVYATAHDQLYKIQDGRLVGGSTSIPMDSSLRYLSPPTIGQNGTIYVYAYDGTLHALHEGRVPIWTHDAGSTCGSGPVLGPDGTIYITAGSLDGHPPHRFIALNSNGTLKWEREVYSVYRNSIAVGNDGTIYLTETKSVGQNLRETFLRAVDANGQESWNVSLGDISVTSPVVGEDGHIYLCTLATFDGLPYNLFSILPNGTLDWTYDLHLRNALDHKPANDPAVSPDGIIYVPAGDSMMAVNPNGTLRWIHEIERGYVSTPVVSKDGTVYFGTQGADKSFSGNMGLAYAISPDGKVKWSTAICSGTPSAAAMGSDGTLYFAGVGLTGSGEIIALNGGIDPAIVTTLQIAGIVALSVVAVSLAAFLIKRVRERRGGP